MSRRRKDLEPPLTRSGLSETLRHREEALRSRYNTDDSGNATSASRQTKDENTTSRRSWYMDTASADNLTRLVDDLHYASRKPKHQVLAAIVAEAMERKDSIAARLEQE